MRSLDAETAHVIYEEDGPLARVHLNRPRKRNALTRAMLEQLAEIFAKAGERRDLRAVILSGEGRDFCAGTEIEDLQSLDEEGARDAALRGQQACDRIESCGVPVIAAVQGAAAGGGCELALACHLRIAATSARFALPETKLGVIPAYGGTQRLTRSVGAGRALAAMLLSEDLPAEEALRLGLVNRVVAHAQLFDEASSLARTIIRESAPLAVRACLEAVTAGGRLPLAEGLKLEVELFSRLFATRDVREGTRAFLEKRAPDFKGE